MTDRKKPIPPVFARKVLLCFLRPDLAEEVLGDLEEKFHATVRSRSVWRARFSYWYQVLNYFRPFAIRKKSAIHPQNHYAMYRSYWKIGWRNLLKNKGYSLINIGGLATGMSVAMLMAFWTYDELSFNTYHRDHETIAQVFRNVDVDGDIETNHYQTTGLGTLLRTEYAAHFRNVVMVRGRIEDRVIAFGEKRFVQNGYFMQSGGPEMFGLKMTHGSQGALKDKNTIFLSASLARKLFGDENPLSRVVTMNARWDLKVTGVYEDLPQNSTFHEASYIAPLDLYVDRWGPQALNAWDNYFVWIYVQIHPGGDFETVSAAIRKAMLPHVSGDKISSALFLHPMAKWHLYNEFVNGVSVSGARMRFVWLYAIIGVFVLLLACINFMNLSTARSGSRAREVGIRKSIGSQRSQLIQQFFGESLLVAAVSFVISLIIVGLALEPFNEIAGKNLAMPWNEPEFWGACTAFTVLTGLLAGSYPALYLSSFNPVKVLKGTFKAGMSARIPRSALVVLQFTVSISLIIGTLVVYEQIQFAKNRPAGYSTQGLISLRARSPEFWGKYQLLRTELRNTGVVEEIAEANYPVTSFLGWNDGFSWKGKPIAPSFNTIFVTHEYGKTVGLEFVDGRDFSRDRSSDAAGILLNESARREMGLENPVGEYLTWAPGGNDRGTYQILGIVKDMVKDSPFGKTYPSVIFASEQDQEWLYIRIDPRVSPHEAIPLIREVFLRLIPSAPFDYTFADEAYNAKFRAEERIGELAAVFSVLAILISCSGLFGLASFVAEQRTKEIGIRKVLGATKTNVWTLLTKEFVLLVLVAGLIAIPPGYYVMDGWLKQYDYHTTIPWYALAAAGAGALAVTLLTVSYQAIRAFSMSPVSSLKSE